MERNDSPLLLISEDDLKEYKDEITAYLKNVEWKPDNKKHKSEIDFSFLIESGKALNIDTTDHLSIIKNLIRISDDRIILSNSSNYILNAVRDGFCLGRHVSKLYSKSSGLDLLMQKNSTGNLHQSEMPEFHDKSHTQSAVFLFTAASYITYQIENYLLQDVSSINIEFSGIPEVVLSRPSKSLQSILYYYCAYLERSGIVNNDLSLIKITELYFSRLIDEIILRKDSFKYSDAFTNNHYKLNKTEFVIKGFELQKSISVNGKQFNSIQMEDIVANKQAKHLFKRYADRLMCYDLETQRNPLNELGGLPAITMADGKPGTGKSMLIAAVATLLKERCDQLGYNFLFWPLPETIVSTYQGGTAERAMEWFRPMQDPGKIIFAPIDDAENNLEERTRQGVSAGVREFIGVFLRNTEGAYAINHGNRLISLFTNIPDQIDKAVLSRVQMRVSMNGASVPEDFIDQDYLWWRKYQQLDPKFVDTKNPPNYEYMAHQKRLASLDEISSSNYLFTNEDVEEIFQNTKKVFDPTTQEFFGNFYTNVLKQYPFFSSRDLRNIQKAIDGRVIDFDLPEIWWEKPDEFFFKPYSDKVEILKSLMKENMKGATFTRLRLYEALNYIETAIRINETGLEREIIETAQRMHIQQEASARLKKGTFND